MRLRALTFTHSWQGHRFPQSAFVSSATSQPMKSASMNIPTEGIFLDELFGLWA
ncbi:hypothetical protein SAMN05660463_00936 [Pseudomonas sp. URIL14HWK12:I9]|nr:hypothetical protein F474_00468 [Pseudomonas sp. URIL14HWK12:I12]PVZ26943.1 hypothetical protein F470_00123 [Pseudomonas sp. URIL14HWK12:I10]PVZ37832.1 hypothetical protein F472_00468 [Pseudomonas sp. URIL14HWK12:I11]SNZ05489.1 hypothetical protein SAMN05660463_00936 [Pseudomonas sp. URIL14HWK12:I9]